MRDPDSIRLPLDVSRCTGRHPEGGTCKLRDTCKRYRALISDRSGEQVPVMMRTDERGFCAFYLYMEIGGER
jgi:hypothetical protein